MLVNRISKAKRSIFVLLHLYFFVSKEHSLPRAQPFGADGNFCHLSHS